MSGPLRPQKGVPTLFVYRECPCGDWVLTGEGAIAPICPACGGRYVPGGGPTDAVLPLYGRSHAESREIRGLGVIGYLGQEIPLARLVASLRATLGLAGPESSEPHFTEAERGERPTSEGHGTGAANDVTEAVSPATDNGSHNSGADPDAGGKA